MASVRVSSFARNGLFLAVALILVLQARAYRLLAFDERKLVSPQLHLVPMQLGTWSSAAEQSLDDSIVNYLKPDDYILRDYSSAESNVPVNLFVAYFKSLEKTYGPHAPRICLPGSGWLESSSKVAYLPVPGAAGHIPVNQLTYEKAGTRILVLYWYQNNRNIWAEEFQAKLRLLPDLIKYKRSDVSLVRLIAPLRSNAADTELTNCVQFMSLMFPSLVKQFGDPE